MSDTPVPIPARFRADVRALGHLASAAESDPIGSARHELIRHLAGIRSRLSSDDASEFRSVVLRESGLALLLGAPTIAEVGAARVLLEDSVSLGSARSQLQSACLADLATAEIAQAIAANDRTALMSALSRGDDPDHGPDMLAQTGLALSLLPPIAPDLMVTSLGSPAEFTEAIPGWEARVVTHGARKLDDFLLSMASARLHVLRAFNSTTDSVPSPVERVAEALLLVERFAPASRTHLSRWARCGPFGALAIGTTCATTIASIALLGASDHHFRSRANRLLEDVAARKVSSPRDL